ncbi:RHS repeat-associated core domain-containing protein [Candidatus Venteria ishoeyi]|uniref:RHS repeat-associated core domain-containing protein n=1 Tax=Candidatus Venteria ishoeyi TaxID=1899563 RepID=UPI0015A7FA97|nr:RHS repeat-associated core domain-containing protein [Candidatus Venteria ishoeyi]
MSLYGKWHVDILVSIDGGVTWELVDKKPFGVAPNWLESAYERDCFKYKFDPIDTSSGAQVLSHDLLTVQGVIPLTFKIDYNSLLLDESILGRGWYTDYFGARIEKRVDGIVVHWTPQHSNYFHRNPDGEYVSLEVSCRFDEIKQDAEGLFTVIRGGKRIYKFDGTGRLSHLGNKHGQFLEISYLMDGYISKITEPVSGVYLEYTYANEGLLDKVTDPLGREVSFGYDMQRRLISITDAEGLTTEYTYNEHDQIVSGINADGVEIFHNTFDSRRRVIKQEDAVEGNVLAELTYGTTEDEGTGTIVTNRDGAVERFYYDRNRNLTRHKQANGDTIKHAYDQYGQRTSTTDAHGRSVWYEYDVVGGKLSKTTDANGYSTNMVYDENRNLISITDAKGHVTRYEYNADNNRVLAVDAAGNQTRYSYNQDKQLSTVTRPGGGVTRYAYSKGRIYSITDPQDNTEYFQYDDAGRVSMHQDTSGNKTFYNYDGRDRVKIITDALERRTYMQYDSRDNIILLTDAKGNTTRYNYDAEGRLSSETNALNQTTKYEYDGEGRPLKITDAKGHSTEMRYDENGRLLATQDGMGNVQQTKYLDKTDAVHQEIDALGQAVATYTYDANYKPLSITNALGHTQRIRYDAKGRAIRTLDPLNLRTSVKYDALGRADGSLDAKLSESTQGFDADGNRIELKDAKGNITRFEFDSKGRLLSETQANGTRQYTYNARDLLQSLTNARDQQQNYEYDAVGRLTRISDPDGTINYSYDANDNVLTVSDATGTISREYDALDRVVKYTDALGNTLQYAYDAVGNLNSLTYPDGKVVSYGYDAADRLEYVTDWAGRVTQYSYDANGRVTQMQRPNNTVVTYAYDAAGQLLQQKDSAAALIRQYDFVYDAAGNIRQEKIQPAPAYFPVNWVDMSYGDGNRLTAYNGMAVSFDADGNMTDGPLNGGMDSYVFDSRNRLIKTGDTSTYRYDAENQRIAVDNGNGETRYAINPLPALSQTLVRAAPDGTQTYYVYGLGLLGEESNGAYRAYHFDLRGSTVALSDAAGKVLDSFQYAPYGGLVSHHPVDVDTPFLYNGRDGVMSDDNGLYYMRARFYNPEIRRFVNRDVLLGNINDGLSLNRYAYVTGEPVSFVDPFGLAGISLFDFLSIAKDTAKQKKYADKNLNPLVALAKKLRAANQKFYDAAANGNESEMEKAQIETQALLKNFTLAATCSAMDFYSPFTACNTEKYVKGLEKKKKGLFDKFRYVMGKAALTRLLREIGSRDCLSIGGDINTIKISGMDAFEVITQIETTAHEHNLSPYLIDLLYEELSNPEGWKE